MIKTFPFRLDIEKEHNNRMYSVNSNDLKTVKFTFVVTDNGIPLDLTGLTVRIAIRKPDKKAVWQDCTVTNAPKGEVEVILESQAYIKKGEHEAELMLYKGTDTVAITQKFHYRAAEGIMSDKSLKSETVLGPIDEKLAEVESVIKDIREKGTGIDPEARQGVEEVTAQLAEKPTKAEVNALIGNISNGTPLFASNVAGMTDRTRLYVNTTDGLLYIHNGSTFISTGRQYQSTGIAANSVTQTHLSKSGSEVQNYTLTTVPQTNAFTGAFTMVLDKPSTSTGFIKVKIRVQSDQQNVPIYGLAKSGGTFTVVRKATVNLKAGLNEINTNLQIDSGQYFGISFPASTAYFDNSAQLTQWYSPGTTTYNIGGQFVPNYQQHGTTATFSFDYSVISSYPAVTTETMQDESVTTEKYAPRSITKEKIASELLEEFLNSSKSIKRIMSKVVLSPVIVNVKLLGDSIKQGVGGTNFAQNGEIIVTDGGTTWRRNPDGYCWANRFKSMLENKFNCKVTNNACTGTSSSFIVKHLSTLISDDDDIVICTIGTNNRNHAHWLGQSFYNDLETIHKYCSDRGIEVIFMANIPASIEDEKTRVGHMEDINHIISKYTADKGMEYVDMFSKFYNYSRYKDIPLNSLFSDGLHLNDTGHDVYFRITCEELGLVAPIEGATW